MTKEFEQISIKPGFMKYNGGVLFKTIIKKYITDFCKEAFISQSNI